MVRRLTIALLVAFPLSLSCARGDAPAPELDPLARADAVITGHGKEQPWTHLRFQNDPTDFQFLVVSDRTGGHRTGVFPAALAKAELMQPEFIMSVGDLIEGYTEETEEIHAQWDEFQGFFDGLDIPFFYVPGNHDVSNPVMSRVWEERLGRRYYHFRYRDTLFLCLCSDDGLRANLGDAQLDYFRAALAEHDDVRWTLVFIHRPLWIEDQYAESRWTEFEELLGKRDYTVFAGHNHSYAKHLRNDRSHIVLATTGGVSSLRGTNHGEFDHVAWVTITPSGPRIANLLLEGIWDEDVFTTVTERLVAQLQDVQATPALFDAAGVAVAFPALRFRNDEDVPMFVSYSTAPHPWLASPWAGHDSIPPNSVRDLPLPITLPAAGEAASAARIEIDLACAIAPVDHRRIEIVSPVNLAVEKLRVLGPAPAGLSIDGDVAEWGELDFDLQVREPGVDPAACRFGIARSATMLYLAVRAGDDRVIGADPPAERWAHDYVELRIDPRPIRGRSRLTRQWDNRNAIYFACFPLAEPGDAGIWQHSWQAEGLVAKQRITATGFELELGLPLAYLRERGGVNALDLFNLNVTVVDCDDPEGDVLRRSWQPAWHLPSAVVGSGAFALD